MDCCLPKETQQIDRMMEAFAKQYHECNPALFPSQGNFVLCLCLPPSTFSNYYPNVQLSL